MSLCALRSDELAVILFGGSLSGEDDVWHIRLHGSRGPTLTQKMRKPSAALRIPWCQAYEVRGTWASVSLFRCFEMPAQRILDHDVRTSSFLNVVVRR
eukprot:5163208-Amphidinium_carterae.1